MTKISIRAALTAAKALVLKDRAALALYVAMGVVIPYLLHASDPAISLRSLAAVTAGGGFFSGSMTGPMYLFGIMAVVWTAAQFALWNALLPESRDGESRDGPIGEIMYGFVAGFAFLVCYVVLNLLVVFLPLGIISAAIAPPAEAVRSGAISPVDLIVQNLITLVFSTIMAFIAARLWLAGPIMAAEGRMNPLSALAESWRRTAPSRGKLFLLYILLQFVGGLVFTSLLAVHFWLIIENPATPGAGESAMAAVWFMLWLAVFLIQSFIAAGLFEAARDRAVSDVFA